MRFLHTSDLHLGKRIYETSLVEDQIYILNEIIDIAKSQNVDAVLISGDVYDKSIPPAEAVTAFDKFVTALSKSNIKVFIISGNHDSAQRLDFMSELLKKENVFICGSFKGELEKIELSDENGKINIYLLPFIKPSSVRQYNADTAIDTCEDAVSFVLDNADIDYSKRNIILAHQFITGACEDGSEEMSVGGLDNISSDVFSWFVYTALGHIQRAQIVGFDNVRYSGTPLKYSFSESMHNKSVTIVDLPKKGEITIDQIPLNAYRDMRCIKGTYDELVTFENYSGTNTDDYIKATLTDEDDVMDALAKLRTVYPNILTLEYENTRTKTAYDIENIEGESQSVSPIDMLSKLYKMQYGTELTESQRSVAEKLIEDVWG